MKRISDILLSARTIAVVGLSGKRYRPSYGVAEYLKRAGFRIHQKSGGFDSALADGRVVETRIQQGADFLKLSQCRVFHNLEFCMRLCASAAVSKHGS